jgi:hypothetical protein
MHFRKLGSVVLNIETYLNHDTVAFVKRKALEDMINVFLHSSDLRD